MYKLNKSRLFGYPSDPTFKIGTPTVFRNLETSWIAPTSECDYEIGTKQSVRGGARSGTVAWNRNKKNEDLWQMSGWGCMRRGRENNWGREDFENEWQGQWPMRKKGRKGWLQYCPLSHDQACCMHQPFVECYATQAFSVTSEFDP